MSVITLDVAKFREMFPAFAANPPYTNDYIQMRWNIAVCFVSDSDSDSAFLKGDCRENALLYVTAHIMQLENAANGSFGQNAEASAGVIQSATIDKISLAVKIPPSSEKSNFGWWLSQTPYGQNALALLSVAASGGLYIGGLPERSAFRKVGGIF